MQCTGKPSHLAWEVGEALAEMTHGKINNKKKISRERERDREIQP